MLNYLLFFEIQIETKLTQNIKSCKAPIGRCKAQDLVFNKQTLVYISLESLYDFQRLFFVFGTVKM